MTTSTSRERRTVNAEYLARPRLLARPIAGGGWSRERRSCPESGTCPDRIRHIRLQDHGVEAAALDRGRPGQTRRLGRGVSAGSGAARTLLLMLDAKLFGLPQGGVQTFSRLVEHVDCSL